MGRVLVLFQSAYKVASTMFGVTKKEGSLSVDDLIENFAQNLMDDFGGQELTPMNVLEMLDDLRLEAANENDTTYQTGYNNGRRDAQRKRDYDGY